MKRLLVVCVALAAAGCSSVHSNAQMADDNKALMTKFLDRINKHDMTVIDEVFDASYVERTGMPGLPPTRDGVKQMFGMFFKAFPDMNLKVEHLISEGDLVWVHIVSAGTNKGEMMGMPATGKSVKIDEMHLVRVKNGKFVEHWGVDDSMGMMPQLGLMPEPAKK